MSVEDYFKCSFVFVRTNLNFDKKVEWIILVQSYASSRIFIDRLLISFVLDRVSVFVKNLEFEISHRFHSVQSKFVSQQNLAIFEEKEIRFTHNDRKTMRR